MSTYDDAMQTVKDTRACVLYGDMNWAQRVDGLAALIEQQQADLTAANERARVAEEERDAWEAVASIVAREGGPKAEALLDALKTGTPSPLAAARASLRSEGESR